MSGPYSYQSLHWTPGLPPPSGSHWPGAGLPSVFSPPPGYGAPPPIGYCPPFATDLSVGQPGYSQHSGTGFPPKASHTYIPPTPGVPPCYPPPAGAGMPPGYSFPPSTQAVATGTLVQPVISNEINSTPQHLPQPEFLRETGPSQVRPVKTRRLDHGSSSKSKVQESSDDSSDTDNDLLRLTTDLKRLAAKVHREKMKTESWKEGDFEELDEYLMDRIGDHSGQIMSGRNHLPYGHKYRRRSRTRSHLQRRSRSKEKNKSESNRFSDRRSWSRHKRSRSKSQARSNYSYSRSRSRSLSRLRQSYIRSRSKSQSRSRHSCSRSMSRSRSSSVHRYDTDRLGDHSSSRNRYNRSRSSSQLRHRYGRSNSRSHLRPRHLTSRSRSRSTSLYRDTRSMSRHTSKPRTHDKRSRSRSLSSKRYRYNRSRSRSLSLSQKRDKRGRARSKNLYRGTRSHRRSHPRDIYVRNRSNAGRSQKEGRYSPSSQQGSPASTSAPLVQRSPTPDDYGFGSDSGSIMRRSPTPDSYRSHSDSGSIARRSPTPESDLSYSNNSMSRRSFTPVDHKPTSGSRSRSASSSGSGERSWTHGRKGTGSMISRSRVSQTQVSSNFQANDRNTTTLKEFTGNSGWQVGSGQPSAPGMYAQSLLAGGFFTPESGFKADSVLPYQWQPGSVQPSQSVPQQWPKLAQSQVAYKASASQSSVKSYVPKHNAQLLYSSSATAKSGRCLINLSGSFTAGAVNPKTKKNIVDVQVVMEPATCICPKPACMGKKFSSRVEFQEHWEKIHKNSPDAPSTESGDKTPVNLVVKSVQNSRQGEEVADDSQNSHILYVYLDPYTRYDRCLIPHCAEIMDPPQYLEFHVMDRHVKWEETELQYQCCFCDSIILDEESKGSHLSSHSIMNAENINDYLKVIQRYFTYIEPGLYKWPKRKIIDPLSLKCPVKSCYGLQFAKVEKFREHWISFHTLKKIVKYRCHVCHKLFILELDLRKHFSVTHKLNFYEGWLTASKDPKFLSVHLRKWVKYPGQFEFPELDGTQEQDKTNSKGSIQISSSKNTLEQMEDSCNGEELKNEIPTKIEGNDTRQSSEAEKIQVNPLTLHCPVEQCSNLQMSGVYQFLEHWYSIHIKHSLYQEGYIDPGLFQFPGLEEPMNGQNQPTISDFTSRKDSNTDSHNQQNNYKNEVYASSKRVMIDIFKLRCPECDGQKMKSVENFKLHWKNLHMKEMETQNAESLICYHCLFCHCQFLNKDKLKDHLWKDHMDEDLQLLWPWLMSSIKIESVQKSKPDDTQKYFYPGLEEMDQSCLFDLSSIRVEMNMDEKVMVNVSSLICPVEECEEGLFDSEDLFHCHWMNVHVASTINMMECPVCPSKCEDAVILREHLSLEHFKNESQLEEAVSKCPQTPYQFINASSFEFPFITFDTKGENPLDEEAKFHVDPFYQECPVCDAKTFDSPDDFIEHWRAIHIKHVAEEKMYACYLCGACIAKETDMQVHFVNIHNRFVEDMTNDVQRCKIIKPGEVQVNYIPPGCYIFVDDNNDNGNDLKSTAAAGLTNA